MKCSPGNLTARNCDANHLTGPSVYIYSHPMNTIYLVLIIASQSGGIEGLDVTPVASYEMCEALANTMAGDDPPGYTTAIACVQRKDIEKSIRDYACKLDGQDTSGILPSFVYTCHKGRK